MRAKENKIVGLLSDEYVKGFHASPGILAVLEGDFSQLPAHPTHNDWQALALMIDGYGLSDKLGLGTLEYFVSELCLPQYYENGSLPDRPIDLWIFLLGMQRAEKWSGPLEGQEKQAVFDIYEKLRKLLSEPKGVKKMMMSLDNSTYGSYRNNLIHRYWRYQEKYLHPWDTYLDQENRNYQRPPVFLEKEAHKNIIVDPESTEDDNLKLVNIFKKSDHHRWYRSMNSSQALALSVFGNLHLSNHLGILSDLMCDEGLPMFETVNILPENFEMEKKINYLGERRSTSVDVFLSGYYQIAIECKFTEEEVGSCSHIRIDKEKPNYCDGKFYLRENQKEECCIYKKSLNYWDFVHMFFDWEKYKAIDYCPLARNYQLVRNILAAGLKEGTPVSATLGHAILVYDERNPECNKGGKIMNAYSETWNALLDKGMLRKISWQRIVDQIRAKKILFWLTDALHQKYGL